MKTMRSTLLPKATQEEKITHVPAFPGLTGLQPGLYFLFHRVYILGLLSVRVSDGWVSVTRVGQTVELFWTSHKTYHDSKSVADAKHLTLDKSTGEMLKFKVGSTKLAMRWKTGDDLDFSLRGKRYARWLLSFLKDPDRFTFEGD